MIEGEDIKVAEISAPEPKGALSGAFGSLRQLLVVVQLLLAIMALGGIGWTVTTAINTIQEDHRHDVEAIERVEKRESEDVQQLERRLDTDEATNAQNYNSLSTKLETMTEGFNSKLGEINNIVTRVDTQVGDLRDRIPKR